MGNLNARKRKIEAAKRRAKTRDGYRCRVCERSKEDGALIDAAHLLPTGVAFPTYCPWDEKAIISLCRAHHRSFDEDHTPEGKYAWLIRNGLRTQADFVARIAGLVL